MKEIALNAASLAFAAMILLGAAAPAARAALGQPANSVEADGRRMMGRLSTLGETPGAGVTVEQITAPSGTVVREYVSPDGIVFAVSWQGPVPPDLSALLGSYFTEYQAGAAAQGAGEGIHHSTLRTDNLVVETGGHMRSLWGRAFVPALMPAGVDEGAIR